MIEAEVCGGKSIRALKPRLRESNKNVEERLLASLTRDRLDGAHFNGFGFQVRVLDASGSIVKTAEDVNGPEEKSGAGRTDQGPCGQTRQNGVAQFEFRIGRGSFPSGIYHHNR